MPPTTSNNRPGQPAPQPAKTSGLMAKYGAKIDSAVKAHADDETTFGFIRLPGGINNGIALLTECGFKQHEEGDRKGEYYFRAVGEVQEPTEVDTPSGKQIVRGLQTSIFVPVYETKNKDGTKVTSVDENLGVICNHLRMLGGDDYTKGASGNDLEDLAEALVDPNNPIYFKFTTSQSPVTPQYPNPRVWENWHGTRGLEDYVPPEMAGITSDGSGQATVPPVAPPPPPVPTPRPAVAGGGQKPPTLPKAPASAVPAPRPVPPAKPVPQPAKPVTPPKQVVPPTPPAQPVEGSGDVFDPATSEDLDALLADAKLGQPGEGEESETTAASQLRIEELGVGLGIDLQLLRNAPSWDECVALVRDHMNSGVTENGTVPIGFDVGQVVGYRPKDPRTKKPVATPIACTVKVVNAEQQHVDLSAGKASYKAVPFDQLEAPPA